MHAFGIVKALQKAGHTTYLVGGCVRDLLLGIEPKDFDIATSARPEQVRRLIFRSFVIGKRFRLVLVKREPQQFEVATFRRDQVADEESPQEMTTNDNLFGTPEEDAKRRDFTVNGLFYDPVGDQLIDYCHGLEDLRERWVRMIGDPDRRLIEDPIRILRGLRLAHMVGFQLDPDLRSSMVRHADKLPLTALPRRREEFLKLIRLPDPSLAFQEAFDLGVLKHISPHLHEVMGDSEAADIFLCHLRHIHDFVVDKQNPVELFSLLMLAYVRAQVQRDVTEPLKSSEWAEHPKLMPLMRDELGVFKFEQILIGRALHMQSTLQKVEDFSRRGPRRQLAVLRNEAFPLAIALAERDYTLPAKDLVYWLEAQRQGENQLKALPNESRKRRRRRRKKVVEAQLTEAGLVPSKSDTELL